MKVLASSPDSILRPRAGALALLAAFSAAPASAYFLSGAQKGQLLVDGVIRDTAGNAYNVRIVPGYSQSEEFARTYWRAGLDREKRGVAFMGEGLAEVPRSLGRLGSYGTREPYDGMAEGLRESWDAEKYLYGTFMGSGLANAWETYWGNAARAHRRKSFGWWFAYPWAAGKGALNSTLRVGAGVPSSVAVAAYGLALRPAYEVAKPPVLTAADATVGTGKVLLGAGEVVWGAVGEQAAAGTVLPAVTATWNTAVGVPLALGGRAPSPRSVDGWWVAMLPESPDYDQALDERSGLRLDSLGPVLEHEMARFLQARALDSLFGAMQAELDSLEAAKQGVRARYARLRGALPPVPPLVGVVPPAPREAGALDDAEKAYLARLIAERYAGSPAYEALDEAARARLADEVTRNWGANILATPREALGSPYRKTGPHTLLGEEAREVFE